MLTLFQAASDDQFALMGCAAALIGSGFLMYVSYFFGPAVRQDQLSEMKQLIRQRQQLLEERAAGLQREKAA